MSNYYGKGWEGKKLSLLKDQETTASDRTEPDYTNFTPEANHEDVLKHFHEKLSNEDKQTIVKKALDTAGYALGLAFRVCDLKEHITGTVLLKDQLFTISFTPGESVSPPPQAESQELVKMRMILRKARKYVSEGADMLANSEAVDTKAEFEQCVKDIDEVLTRKP